MNHNDLSDDPEIDKLGKQDALHKRLNVLDNLEETDDPGHPTPAYIMHQLDEAISLSHSVRDSRLSVDKEHDLDKVQRIMKGDAGEGYTYTRLLEQYERNRIIVQPKALTDGKGTSIEPDFIVTSTTDSNRYEEIVDAKAWSLMRPSDAVGEKISTDDFMRFLAQQPNPHRLLNMNELQRSVECYSSCPQLASDGKVVLYLPEDIERYAAQVAQKIESWSGTDMVHSKTVEVRSMEVWNQDIWRLVGRRRRAADWIK